jgi:multidrug efflux pump subunit AcrA (membrane-fusion protein)
MLLWAAGFFHRKVPHDVGQMGLTLPATAKRVIVQAVEMPRYETAVGVTQAIHEASVASKILARVIEVNVNAGQVVRAGDILVRLQDEDLDSRVKQLESNASAARARQSQASIEWDRAKVLLPQMATRSGLESRIC